MTAPYLLPVPFWLYVYACAATLLATFAILGYFFAQPAHEPSRATSVVQLPATGAWSRVGRATLAVLRTASVLCLVLTVASQFWGSPDPGLNFGMALFWSVFLLGFTYASAVVGDLFELINPWRVLADWLGSVGADFSRARVRYPAALGYYPAFAFYVALIWIELFVLQKPMTLGSILLTYSAITLCGAWVFGKAAWFRYAEVFSVFFRQIGSLAPIEYMPNAGGRTWRVRLRPFFSGALSARPEHLGLILFVLFMLASTSYDAIYDTEVWLNFYWKFLIVLAQPLWGTDISKAQNGLMQGFLIYKRLGLLLSPFVYMALYLAVMWLMKKLTRTDLSVRQLALDFITSLIPIAFVYNACHYYTLFLTQVQTLPRMALDPFALGWDPLTLPYPTLWYLEMNIVWHSQVALILFGHVVSVYLGHAIALRVFPSRRQAILSQVPLLVLMVAYTAIGLYILSLPLAVAQLRD